MSVRAFGAEEQRRIVALASLAPSTHNTQPARWRFTDDGAIEVRADPTRRLPRADPHDHDLLLACGAAVEGTVLALSVQGIAADVRENVPGCIARIVPVGASSPDPLAHCVANRHTWRGGFVPASKQQTHALRAWAGVSDDVILATGQDDCRLLARCNDDATLFFLRDASWRAEHAQWLRLSPRHPGWARDGVNRAALHLPPVAALGAQWALGAAFPWLDRLGIAGLLLAERRRSAGATAIVCLQRPVGESQILSGRLFYRRWLELTGLGFAVWPMSALVDDPAGAAALAARFAIPSDRRLLAAWRVGVANGPAPRRARLPVEALISP